MTIALDSFGVGVHAGGSAWAESAVELRGRPFEATMAAAVGVDFLRLGRSRWMFGATVEYSYVRYVDSGSGGEYAHRPALELSAARLFDAKGFWHGPKLALGPYATYVRNREGGLSDLSYVGLLLEATYAFFAPSGLNFGAGFQSGFGRSNGAGSVSGGLRVSVGYVW